MKRHEILSALLIHVIEEADHEGVLISHQERREGDQFLEGDRAGTPTMAIAKRAMMLLKKVSSKAPLLCQLSQEVNTLGKKFLWALALLGFGLGLVLHSLGEGRYFHLLSPVLLSVMLWNLLSLSFLAWSSFNTKQAVQEPAQPKRTQKESLVNSTSKKSQGVGFTKLLQWMHIKWLKFILKHDSQAELKQTIALRFLQKLFVLNQEQISAEIRRSLHLMSISFLLGISVSAYWDGLIHEYQASAESTFLSRESIEQLLSFLLYPSTLFGLGPISLEQFSNANPQKLLLGPAAIWVHRYVLSLLFWIGIPRLIFVCLESLKVWRNAHIIPLRLSWLEPVPTLNIALASHTNIGKTSLARTLLKRDVGEVRNEEHVTRTRASYFLLKNDQFRVRLWDTPGFGELRSTEQLNNQDQHFEYALETEAIQTLKEEADVIFYLVPARPSAKQKQEVKKELQLISQANTPIIIMINRLYDGFTDQPELIGSMYNEYSLNQVKTQVSSDWQQRLKNEIQVEQVKSVLILDAFERSYQDEQAIFKVLSSLDLADKKQLSLEALQLWEQNLDALFEALALSLSRFMQELLALSVKIPSNSKKERKIGQEYLTQKSETLIRELLEDILDHIGLEGQLRDEIFKESLETSLQQPERKERRKWGAIIGGALSGLGTGVAADVMAGGLTLGGGMIVGAVLGAIGGMGVVEGYDYLNESEREIGLCLEAIYSIHQKLMLFILSASTHGRAQGIYQHNDHNAEGLDYSKSASTPMAHSLLEFSKKLHRQTCQEINQLAEKKYKKEQLEIFESIRQPSSHTQEQQKLLDLYKRLLKESLMSI